MRFELCAAAAAVEGKSAEEGGRFLRPGGSLLELRGLFFAPGAHFGTPWGPKFPKKGSVKLGEALFSCFRTSPGSLRAPFGSFFGGF